MDAGILAFVEWVEEKWKGGGTYKPPPTDKIKKLAFTFDPGEKGLDGWVTIKGNTIVVEYNTKKYTQRLKNHDTKGSFILKGTQVVSKDTNKPLFRKIRGTDERLVYFSVFWKDKEYPMYAKRGKTVVAQKDITVKGNRIAQDNIKFTITIKKNAVPKSKMTLKSTATVALAAAKLKKKKKKKKLYDSDSDQYGELKF